MRKNILFIVGSLREKSFNLALARMAEEIIGQGANISYLDYKDLPTFNQDIEFPTPPAVTRLRQTVAAADALWVFTPEYNRSYPGHVKNIFDWLSRPPMAGGSKTSTPIYGKKVTLSGAGGMGRTAKSRNKLTEVLLFIGAEMLPASQTGVPLNKEELTYDELAIKDEQIEELKKQADRFLKFIS